MENLPLASQCQRHPCQQCLAEARQNEPPSPGLLCIAGLFGLLLFGYCALSIWLDSLPATPYHDGRGMIIAMGVVATALALLSLIASVGNAAEMYANYRRRKQPAAAAKT